MLKKILITALSCMMFLSFADLSLGKGGRGGGGFGGGRSSGGSRSFGGSSRSSPAPKSSSTPRGSGGFTGSSSSTKKQSATTTKQNNLSSTDTKLYQRAQQQGTAFKTRSEAQSAFKQKYSSQYTSKYSTEPKTRPSHIPQTTSVGGKTYNITYNQAGGGYGYWNGGGPGLGTFLLFDAMSDAVVMSSLMSQHGYYYGATPVSNPVNSTVVHHTNGFVIFFSILGVVGLAILGIAIISRS